MIGSRKPHTRADQVRTRRVKEMKQRVIIATDVVRNPAPYTPIYTRNGEGTLPIIQKPHKRSRRKFFYAFKNGVEIKLPAIPVFKPGWRLVSAALFVISAFCIYSFWTSPFFTVNQIHLTGAERITAEEIESIVPVTGQKILGIMPGPIEKVIKNAYPVIEKVDVVVGWPSTISIHVEEREPVLIWNQDSTVRWISADGIAFEPKGEAEGLVSITAAGNPPSSGYNLNVLHQESKKSLASMVLPVQNAKDEDESEDAKIPVFIDPELIPAIQEMAKQAPAGVPLVYSPMYGIGWFDTNGWKVFFGMQPKEMPQKLAAYQIIVEKLLSQDIHPKLISMENLYAPYYRTEQ
jgi:hypothetical protein